MTASSDDIEGVVCHSYTYARRYPLVIGKIGGAQLWWPLSVLQMSVLCASLITLFGTRSVWAHLSGPANLVIALGVPVALTWAVRHMRLEGRSPLRTLLGAATYALAPTHGLRHGRPVRPPRPSRLGGARVYVRADTVGE